MCRSDLSLSSVAAGSFAAVFVFASVFIAGDVLAQSIDGSTRSHAAEPIHADPGQMPLWRPLPALPPYMPEAEPGDAFAALEALDIALRQASDGSSYVWRRGDGRLAGAIRPTSTFRNAEGRICRHLQMRMRLGTYTRTGEAVACRAADGVWDVEG